MKTKTDLDSIPDELKTRPQWVGFKLLQNDVKKIPVIADKPDRKAKSNNPDTWRTFDIAAAGLRKGKFDAIGLALAGDFIVIDLDDCFKDGKLTGAPIDLLGKSYTAKSIIQLCQSYTETSALGQGVHIVLKGKLPPDPFTNRRRVIEIYGRKRFIIFTGDVIGKGLSTIRSNPEAINKLVAGLGHGDTGHGDINDIQDIEGHGDIERYKQVMGHTQKLSITKLSITERAKLFSAIDKTVPTGQGQRNSEVFNLVRLLKFDYGMDGLPFSELKPFVKYWHKKALPVIATKDFDSTWADFCYAWPRARSGLRSDPVALAWKKVCAGAQCPANDYETPAIKKLLALCYVLHENSIEKNREFFLAMGKAGGLLGVKAMQVSRWLKMFEADGFLVITKKGRTGSPNWRRANRYRWIGGDITTKK